MSKFITYKITKDEEVAIKQFYHEIPTAGNMNFSLEREPDIFAALEVEGFNAEIIVVKDTSNNQLACAAVKSRKVSYKNGLPTWVGYLSGLRVGEKYRNSFALGRLFKYFNDVFETDRCTFYLTSVFEDNIHAANILTSKKANIPIFEPFCNFRTFVFKPQSPKRIQTTDFQIRRANINDLTTIVSFLNNYGQQRQFFPKYEISDFNQNEGILKNLKINDIALAFRGNNLVGTMALWNQTAFRQWKIHSYSKWFRFFRRAINLLARMKRMPEFPKAGNVIDYNYLSLIAIADSNPQIFDLLLTELSQHVSAKSYFTIGFTSEDVLFQHFPIQHITLKSRIYIVYLRKDTELIRNIDKQLSYIELASL